MNILFVRNADFDVTEANKIQVIKMCRAFQKNNCPIILLAFGRNTQEIRKKHHLEDPFPAFFIKNKIRFFVLGDITLFLFFLKQYQSFDNIFTRDIIFALLVKLFFKKKKVFLEVHDVPNRCWWKWIYRKFSFRMDRIIVISQGLKDGLIKIGLKETNMKVLHDGVNVSEFDIALSQEEARSKLDLPLQKIIVTYVGSIKKDRDIPAFIDAARKMPEVIFVVFGFGKDQKYLLQAANKIPNFIFKGYTSNPEMAYRAADILFAGYTNHVPTIDYMSPLKIFEYIATKRPIVVADFPRIREVLDEKEVYFYESENSENIVLKIKEIIKDQETANTKSLNAYKKAQANTWENRAEKIISMMKE